jgi:hypothetical protein
MRGVYRSRLFVVVVAMLLVPSAVAAQKETDPTDGSKDVDRVMHHAQERVLDAAKQALVTYGCEVKKEKTDSLECTRARHVGILVGSGGEKVTVQLSPKDGGTRVVIKTGKGFVGRLGKKNWSTPIFAEIERLLQQS